MRGCLGFSVVKFLTKRRQAYWISQGLQPKRIDLGDGTTMHCWVKSSPDNPAVLLIHGFGGDGLTAWDKQISALGKQFNLYIPDLIFFGESTTSSSQRSEIFQSECMKSMLERLEVKSVMVVGHSYGGFVGFWMAHQYPQLVRRLVIVSSAVCMTPSTNDDLLTEFGAADIKEVLLPNNVAAFKRSINLTIYRMPWLPNFICKDWMEVTGINLEQRAQLMDALVIGSKITHPLPNLNQDVLIVWGECDRIFKLEQAYLLQRHVGEKSKVVLIKECGHVPSAEKPAELNKALLDFLLDGN